jgi:hypothetical protein
MEKNQQAISIKTRKNLILYLAFAGVIVIALFYYINYSSPPDIPMELMRQGNIEAQGEIPITVIESGIVKKGEYEKVVADKKYKALKDFYPNDFDKAKPGKDNPFIP